VLETCVHVCKRAERMSPSEMRAIRALLTGAYSIALYMDMIVSSMHVLDAVSTVAVLASLVSSPTKSFPRPAASTNEASRVPVCCLPIPCMRSANARRTSAWNASP